MPRRSPALVLSAATALAAAVMLAGCTTPGPSATTPPPPSPSGSPSATTEPTETAAPPSSTPVDIACDALISAQAMYDFNPNFSLLASWKPSAGSAAAKAVDADGVACRWQNDTSGDVIDVSVASFDAGTLKKLANDAYASSTMVPTYDVDEAYFTVTGGTGEAILFDGSFWIVVRSNYFLEPGDAEPIVGPVLAALA